jgi:CoA-dependent NAD(P)H sulfur oxidoreductase
VVWGNALEMCEAFKKIGIHTSMVKPGLVFLPWLAPKLAHVIYEELIQEGVEIYSGTNIEKIEPLDSGVNVVCTKLNLKADMVLVAMGVKPCSEIAEDAGLDLGISDSISVNRELKTSDENIYSAGDCADAYHIVSNKKCCCSG